MAEANRSTWTRGVALRCRALVEPEPEILYRDAIEILAGARLVVDLARAELL